MPYQLQCKYKNGKVITTGFICADNPKLDTYEDISIKFKAEKWAKELVRPSKFDPNDNITALECRVITS